MVAVALMTMLLLAPVVGLMPQATLAAVVIVYSIGLIQPVEFRAILKVRRTEFLWALIALAGVVLLGTLKGILVAIIASIAGLAHQVSDPPVHVLGRKPGTNVFRPRQKNIPRMRPSPAFCSSGSRGGYSLPMPTHRAEDKDPHRRGETEGGSARSEWCFRS